MEVGDGDLLVRRDRHDLLREHVEWVPRDHRLLDRTLEHPLRDDGRLQQVGTKLGKDPTARDGAELVSGPSDALQSARDRLRRLDLDDEIDRAHVDAELQRGGGHEARDLPPLQELLDLDPLLACE